MKRASLMADGLVFLAPASLICTKVRGQVLQSRIQIARLSSFVVLLTASGIGIVANHLTMTKADRDLVEKFGAPYREYMNQVPR